MGSPGPPDCHGLGLDPGRLRRIENLHAGFLPNLARPAGYQDSTVVEESIKTWEVSTRWIEWLRPRQTITYWLTSFEAPTARP